MRKKTIIMTVMVLILFLTLSSVASTQGYSRNITAWFHHMKVELDGEIIDMKNEPFYYDGEIYVPINDLADALYLNVIYDEKEKTLKIGTNGLFSIDPDASAATLSYQRAYEVAALNRLVEELQKELAILKTGRFPYQKITSLSEMEKYLKEYFGTLDGIRMSIQLRHRGGDRYLLNAAFDAEDLIKWYSLDRRTIENWIDDMFYAMRELYNPRAEIEGNIRYSHLAGTTHVDFYTRGNRLYFEFELAKHKESQQVDGVKLEEILNRNLRYYSNEGFTYEIFVNRYDVDLLVYAEQQYFDHWTPSLKMQYLKRLRNEIEKYNSSIRVNGKIIEAKNKQDVIMNFSIAEGKIRSIDLLNDIENYLNENYQEFMYDGHIFTFTYTVNEGFGNSFEVLLKGDFLKSESRWKSVETFADYHFEIFVEKAFRYIESIWDVDIFGEVYDKNLESICDLDFYRIHEYTIRTLQPIIFK